MIKGLVFDMDGVIAETARLHYDAWKDVVSKIGINYSEEENVKLKGLPRMETLTGILKAYNKTDISQEQMEKMAEKKNAIYLKMLNTSITEKDILPGVKKLLNAAKNKGLKMAIASSSKNAPLILEKLLISHYFEYIVDPNKIANGKPAPDIYIKAAEGIKLTPEECIGFEDAMPGVEGLLAAKMPAVAITHGDKGDWDITSYVISNTKKLDLDKILKHFS